MWKKLLMGIFLLLYVASLMLFGGACAKYQSITIVRGEYQWLSNYGEAKLGSDDIESQRKYCDSAPSLPLNADDDITEYAWKIQKLLTEDGFITSTDVPTFVIRL